MHLREFFDRDAVSLDLQATTREEVLPELVSLLGLDERSEGVLVQMLERREGLGSTGIGRGFAVPHCRSLVVNELRVAYGRHNRGIDFQAIDGRPVHHFFVIVAPPLEVSNLYLPVLGRLAQLAKVPDMPGRLLAVRSADEFLQVIEDYGA
jgi:PTS system nitrogen regulatory IIA component